MTFGERLKAAREKKQITQQKLAEDLGKSRSTIAGYEINDRLPDFDMLKRLASYFNLSIDYLVGSDIREETDSYKTDKTYLDVSDLTKEQIKELENFKNFIINRDT